jgi:methylenetetrahydrofolate dehydrogenase (NADP+)/methenyltetrahydrofolate cyclohydrolase
MPTILSGRVARDELKKPLAAKIKSLQEKLGAALTLAIIQVGDRADSTAYINAKKKFAAEIGVSVKLVHLAESVRQEKITAEIKKLNQDKEITGIIVQLPLPKSLDEGIILDIIDPAKDADAITSTNVKKWSVQGLPLYQPPTSTRTTLVPTTDQYKDYPCTNRSDQGLTLYPATARGVDELLEFYKIFLKGKSVCVIGRSKFVGTPIACLCRNKGAIVSVCHSKTENLVKETLAADVIISVVGKAGLITAEHVKKGQIIIDVGLSRVSVGTKTKLAGDVDFEQVSLVLGGSSSSLGAITPVPGGVGPMTVIALFENLTDCAIL